MAERARERVDALDWLRGLAVAGMILVDSPGSWTAAWTPLQHAPWDGMRAADLVFPTFLFAVGAAFGLSFPRAWGPAERWRFWTRIARRVAALVAIGLAIEATGNLLAALAPEPHPFRWGELRLPGILQRIALCYALGAGVAVATGRGRGGRLLLAPGRIAAVAAVTLALYWAAMLLVPVPGGGAGRLDPAGNLAGHLDRALFGPGHLWALGTAVPGGPRVYDPEGLLSTLPATTDLLFGLLAAALLRARGPRAAAAPILVGGLALLAAGLLLGPWVPLNKRLWSPSFALASGGWAAIALAALLLLGRARAAGRWLTPLRVLGGNAILAFVLSAAWSRFGGFPFVPSPDGPMLAQAWGYRHMLALVPDPGLAAFLCALGILLAITLTLWPLHTRAIHFRV